MIGAALKAMALGRPALGGLSLASPRAAARGFGMGESVTLELEYMARVFGIRAIALGSGYLLSDGQSRKLWQRLGFACDISDTVACLGHLRRNDLPGPTAGALTAMTGGYTAIGAARILADDAS